MPPVCVSSGFPSFRHLFVKHGSFPLRTDILFFDVAHCAAQIQAIQAAMAGFELPSSHVPPWAKDVPEEEWKQCLYRKLKGLAVQQS